jgi:hypothetical protein
MTDEDIVRELRTTPPEGNSDCRAGLSIEDQLADWRIRCLLDAIRARDEYTAGNVLMAAATAGIRRHLRVKKHKPTMPVLRDMIAKAADAAIAELERLRSIAK